MENTDDKIIELCHWVMRESKRKKNGFRNDLHLHLDRIKKLTTASVRPEVVVPSEKDFMNAYNINAYYGNVYEFMLSELKSLNPDMTFAELNHTAPTGDKSDEG